jgi:choline-sulfatase
VEVTLPQHFAVHGYRTAAAGKIWHLGTGGGKPAEGSTTPPEFEVVGSAGGIGAKPEKKLVLATPLGNHPLMDWGVFPHRDEDKGDWQVATWAIAEIEKAPRDRPFFIAAGFFLPHVPCYVTQRWYDLFPDDDRLLPEIFEADRADTPRFSRYLHWKLPEPRLDWVTESGEWRNLARSYLASTAFVDAQIGRILEALERSGLAENTIVVVWGDHGWHLGEKGITGKNSLWEESTRVPLIFAGPGVKAAQRCARPVELLDVYPTLIELCGLAPRDDLEGLSLAPQLADADSQRERPALTSHNQGNHAVRSERYRYIRYADGSEELYDLALDPGERTNIAARTELAAVIEAHRKWLPEVDEAPAPGSAHRILTYDKASDEAVWEGETVRRSDPIPR